MNGIDLRSDTVTKPTPEMRRAMYDAEVADDGLEGDPTTQRLEEMAAEQLAMRILGEASGIPSEKVRRGQLSESDFLKVVAACQQLENTPFFIDDTPALTVAALRTRARRLKRQHRLGIVVVDYLQLLNSTGRYDNRVLEISEVTRGLKVLAKELDVPVLALSQLSRAVEQREDKRPLLSDLRESGAIEQDADVVLFIYREEY